jgi:hypothetical protein
MFTPNTKKPVTKFRYVRREEGRESKLPVEQRQKCFLESAINVPLCSLDLGTACMLMTQLHTQGYNADGSWVGLRASLHCMEKRNVLTLPGFEAPSLSPLARSQSLYQLQYRGYLCDRPFRPMG